MLIYNVHHKHYCILTDYNILYLNFEKIYGSSILYNYL